MSDFSKHSDEQLIQEVSAGSRPAFEAIYERYKRKMFVYFRHMLGSKESAEDAMHDLFIQLFDKASLFGGKAKFSSWLYAMARNLAYDLLRKRKVRYADSLNASLDFDNEAELIEFIQGREAAPDQELVAREMKDYLARAIEALDPREREVVVLCDIHEIPHQQVADILLCSPQSVPVMLFRAKQKLKRIFFRLIKGEAHE